MAGSYTRTGGLHPAEAYTIYTGSNKDYTHHALRPSSAGATKRPSGNLHYGRTSVGVTNMDSHHHSNVAHNNLPPGQRFQRKQRPSSAGATRPSSQHTFSTKPSSAAINAAQAQHARVHGSGQPTYTQATASSSRARPSSAGPTGRPAKGPLYVFTSGHGGMTAQQYISAQQQHHQQQIPVASQQEVPHRVPVASSSQKPQPTTTINQTTENAPRAPTQRPLSANATSLTSGGRNRFNVNNEWSSSYKLYYGDATGMQSGSPKKPSPGPEHSGPVQSTSINTVSYNNNARSTAAVKLRTVVASAPSEEQPKENGAAAAAGSSEQEVVDPLQQSTQVRLEVPDDEEIDGKRIVSTADSRSHPEVSTSTVIGPTLSTASYTTLGQKQSYADPRETGHTDEQLAQQQGKRKGLSTIPNQFCTILDAVELKKLLLLSSGSRGGIVPSSSAVMDMYMVGKVVGVGSYGKVRAAWHRLTESKVAIKTYDKSKLKDPAHWKRVHSEIKIMEQMTHPRIARMYEAVETPKRMHLIMECLDGGNLCSHVKMKQRLTEEESKRIFYQTMQAIEYLHSNGVSHRDIKLENVLFEANKDKDIKIIDFGFSTVCQAGKKLKVFCGTPSYMAPEIVRRSEYEGMPVDMWSLGILLYALLCGCFPFRAKAYPDLYRRIARGVFVMPEELSSPVKDLLRQLLTVDTNQRIDARGALHHPWLQAQLIRSPDMHKLRRETTILISEKPADDLDDQVITELEKYGMNREEVIRLVLTKTHSSIATLYYLLLDTIIKKRPTGSKQRIDPSRAQTGPFTEARHGHGHGLGSEGGQTGTGTGGSGFKYAMKHKEASGASSSSSSSSFSSQNNTHPSDPLRAKNIAPAPTDPTTTNHSNQPLASHHHVAQSQAYSQAYQNAAVLQHNAAMLQPDYRFFSRPRSAGATYRSSSNSQGPSFHPLSAYARR